MNRGLELPAAELVRVELDFGRFELSANECAELVRLLRARSHQPGGAAAAAAAHRLDAVRRVGSLAETFRDDELDAIADAAWEWLSRAGPDVAPERIVRVLDLLRSRHGCE